MTDEIPEKKHLSVKKQKVVRWRCPNCGQNIFITEDEEPPDICYFCRDMTTWQRVEVEENGKNSTS